MMKTIIKTALIVTCMGLLACSNEEDIKHSDLTENKPENNKLQVSQDVLDDMIQSLPQPIEVAQIINISKMDIGKESLTPSENADNLQDKYDQAMSLGAFGVDLGYINLNEKTMYMIEYLENLKKLAGKLRVDQFFDFETLSKLSKNRNNTDSLVQISTSNFNKIDQYLREQNRGEQSILILIGGWLEGMNMFCEIYNKTKSPDLGKRIAEQKVVFDNIFLVIEKLNKIPYYSEMEGNFGPLKNAYDKIRISYIYKKPIMKEVGGQLVLKDQTETKIDCSSGNIDDITLELLNLRNSYLIKRRDPK